MGACEANSSTVFEKSFSDFINAKLDLLEKKIHFHFFPGPCSFQSCLALQNYDILLNIICYDMGAFFRPQLISKLSCIAEL